VASAALNSSRSLQHTFAVLSEGTDRYNIDKRDSSEVN
jgi:hypothetical protein